MKEFGSINVVEQGELSEGATPPGYTQLLYHNQLDSIIAVTVDHNIIIYGFPELETKKQVSHLNDMYHGNVVLINLSEIVWFIYKFYGASYNFLSVQNMCLL